MATNYETFEYDVLGIGAGGAGLRAAIEASAAGVKVGLVCKSLLGKAHTVMAEGGMAAAMGNVDDRDNWKVHFSDTMRGGQYVNNWRMAELHAKEAPDRVHELEAWGAVFDRTPDGKILQRNFGGHRYPRLAHVGDRTGLELIRTLQDHGIHQGISVHMEHTIITLLKNGDRVSGAFGYERERGRFKIFKAKAIVIATGGIGRAYKITSNSWEYTGDGQSLAYHAGADLRDMEFVQFHPTGMIWPPSVMGILVTEAVRGEGGVLRNKEGRRFMFDDIPDLYKNQTATDPEEGWRYTQGDKNAKRPPELLTRDHVARCIMREVKAGRGSPHGGVFLDIAWIKEKFPNSAEHIKRKLPSMYHQFKQLADLDITKEPMEIGPTTHYVMGGISVNGDSQMSTVPGLFAAGEAAAGLHGANRLGGNSLSDLIVFGKRAGEFAARFAKEHGAGQINGAQVEEAARQALEPFERGVKAGGSAEGPYQVQHDLQEMMQSLVGIVRREEEMVRALEELGKLRERATQVAVFGHREYNPGWNTSLDLKNLLTVSEAVTRSAIERKESRGAHFRDDFPSKDAASGKFNIVIRKGADGSMQVRREPIPEMPAELKQVIEEMK
ncbi:MAG TPA: fumarate reductase/succinate dehydrogenase flavoprotein subunit [Candidatus Saccharimonadales bacterium]|nr:fumarate reductase/succinate dehydrogenase flavoprotein subunit [Candidatus Saccharimonadales bacterium]